MILFEVSFLEADVRAEFFYENLELFIMSIIAIYVPLYYCFHIWNLDKFWIRN